jgi:hypothetical protein
MLKVLVFGFAVGWAWAGWRNLPAIPNAFAGAFGTCLAVSMYLCYYAGTRRKRDAAVAVAVAQAEARALAAVQATQVANAQVVVNLDPALGARRRGEAFGLDSAPWLVGATQRHEIEDETDAVESMLNDVREEQES